MNSYVRTCILYLSGIGSLLAGASLVHTIFKPNTTIQLPVNAVQVNKDNNAK